MGCCSPNRRLPGGASSRHPRPGIVAVVDTARTPAVASVDGPRPACGVHHPMPSSGIRRSSRQVSSPSGVQPSGVQPSGVRSSSRVQGPAGCCPPVQPSGVHPSSVQPPAVHPCPSGRVRLLPHQAVVLGTRPARWGHRHHRNGARSLWAAAPSGDPVDGRAGLGRATLPRSHVGQWRVGGGPGRLGEAAAALDPAERPGGPGRRAERPWLAAALWARPRCVVVVEPDAGWRGPMGLPAGWACGPSAAQADGGRSRLAASSAVTCDDGWWACQDLNLGPHPYQQSRAHRCATRRFCRSCATVGGEVMRCSKGWPKGG